MSNRISNRNVFFLITGVEVIVGLMFFGLLYLVTVTINNGGLAGIFNIYRILILISLILGFLFIVVVSKIILKWL